MMRCLCSFRSFAQLWSFSGNTCKNLFDWPY